MKTYANFCRILGFILLSSCLLQLAMAQQVVTFKNKRGHTLQARIDAKTGTASRISGLRDDIRDYGFDKTQVSRQTIDVVAKRLISDYSSVLKVTSDIVRLKKADTDGSWWFVDYEQTFAGIPVYSSEIGFSVDPQGYIVTLGARAYPQVNVTPTPRVSASRAIEVARRYFLQENANLESEPSFVILPLENESSFTYHLAWKLQLISMRPLKNFIYFISAEDGSLLKEQDNVVHGDIYGTVRGTYWPVRRTDATVTAPFVTTNISLRNTLGQEWRVNTDANGFYRFVGFSTGTYELRIPQEGA